MNLFFGMIMALTSVFSNAVKQAPDEIVALLNGQSNNIVQASSDVSPAPTPTPETAVLPVDVPGPSPDTMEITEPAPTCPAAAPAEPAPPSDVVIRGTISIQGIEVPFQLTGVLPGLGIRVGQYEFVVNTPTGS